MVAAAALAATVYYVRQESESASTTVVANNKPAPKADHPAAVETSATDPSSDDEERPERATSSASERDLDGTTMASDEVRDGPGIAPVQPQLPPSMPAEQPIKEDVPEKPRTLADLATVAERPGLSRRHRDAPPEGKALTAANVQFSQLFGKEIARTKKVEVLRDLAIRQLNRANRGENAADVRYVMLNYAGTVAANQGNLGLAYRVAAEAAHQFEVDGLSLKAKALEATGKNAQSPQAYAIGALQALALAERAVSEGKFEVSAKASGQATLFARKVKDKDLTAEVEQCKAALRERSSRNSLYKKAMADLKKNPEDEAANLAAGKYDMLVLGNWKEGLARFAASRDARFIEVAGLEAESRVDPSQLAPLAAAWWNAAEQETDAFFQAQCRLQAKYCYLRARQSGRAGGLPQDLAEQLRNLPGYPLSRLVSGVAARYYDGADFQRQKVERAEDHIDFHYGEGSPDPAVQTNFFSARWTGFIKPPITGRYQIVTFTNDSIRLWIDGKQVLNRWGHAAGWQQVDLELTDEPHTFRMEYNETFEVAIAMLGWTLAAFPDEQHLEWSPIDALYYDPESPFELPEQKLQ